MRNAIRTIARSRRTRHERGMAMLLVLIALAMATIMASAYLASRDNSAAISDNVTSAAESRWAAATGLDMGVAILQTETAWYEGMSGNLLLDDYVINGATVDVSATDLETDAAPTADSTTVRLTATARANGIEQTASAIARLPKQDADVIDIDLSEFAVFASEKLTLNDTSTITRWSTAPKSALNPPLALGTSGLSAGTVELTEDAAAIDSTVYHAPGASATLVSVANGTVVDSKELPDAVPLLDPPAIPVPYPGDPAIAWVSVMPKISWAWPLYGHMRVEKLETDKNTDGHIGILGDYTFVSEGDFTLDANTGLSIFGDVTLVVFNDLHMADGAFIKLVNEDSRLTIHVAGDIHVEAAYIGDAASINEPATDGSAPWMNPERIMIYGHAEKGNNLKLDQAAVVKASIYAPQYKTLIDHVSALYGRLAAADVKIQHASAIFYDPALDSGGGYTSDSSAIYDADGVYKQVVYSITDLSEEALRTAAASDSVRIATANGEIVDVDGSIKAALEAIVIEPTVGVATPRTKDVPVRMTSFGSSTTDWEDRAQ